ncbi:MAG: tRNA (adenosine(37)-N6)-threonylcarbamoyltransferase complex dimerization subunit type 1 TsaB [Ruminococcaceae bacterium]|nr:tRNA (adenosine(37)-N6)-threonylcarbamoyltransferase complex dimerization subunit type 1 TsaB [Oscillospiraceae bacterium]
MKILGFDSSAKAASVALTDNGKLLCQYWQASGLTHSRTLLAMAEDMLKNLDMKVNDVDAVAVSIGPGSFTGIRIGVAAVKGLSWAADKPACGVSTLEAMAYHLADRENVVICPVMDARRGQVYNAKFEACEEGLKRLCDDRAISAEELINEAKNDEKIYFLVGDGADLCYNKFKEAGVPVKIAPEHLRLQSAWGVCKAAETGELVAPDTLTPNYLRLSQAERERLEKMNNK